MKGTEPYTLYRRVGLTLLSCFCTAACVFFHLTSVVLTLLVCLQHGLSKRNDSVYRRQTNRSSVSLLYSWRYSKRQQAGWRNLLNVGECTRVIAIGNKHPRLSAFKAATSARQSHDACASSLRATAYYTSTNGESVGVVG